MKNQEKNPVNKIHKTKKNVWGKNKSTKPLTHIKKLIKKDEEKNNNRLPVNLCVFAGLY